MYSQIFHLHIKMEEPDLHILLSHGPLSHLKMMLL